MLLVLLSSLAARSAEPYLSTALGASYWALGVKLTAKPGLEQDLWSEEGSLLFEDTFVRPVLNVEITPSYTRVGPEVTFAPIAVFELAGQVVMSGYYGTYSSLLGFDEADADYSDDALDVLIDEGKRSGGTGLRFGGDATLQGKVGPVAAVVNGALQRWLTHPGEGFEGTYFFEPEMSLMMALEDTAASVTGLVLYDVPVKGAGRSLLVGSITQWQRALATEDTEAKTGAVAIYEPGDHWQYVVLVQPYLIDRVYTQALPPYVAAQVKWTR